MRPVGSKVIFRRAPDKEVSKGGIILPNSGVKRYSKGEVVSYPEFWVEGGTLRPTELMPGDIITFTSSKSDQLEGDLWWVEVHNIIYVEREKHVKS